MNRVNTRTLILLNGLMVSLALLIWMVTHGSDTTAVYGATRPIPFTYDKGPFNITDLSIKEGDYSPDIIGFIENTDPFENTIKGVTLKIELYDRNNHLIDVAESGYSALPATFEPHTKSAFKVPIEKNNELDHVNIQILADDRGNAKTYSNQYSSNRPYVGIVGLALTPDFSKQLGLNQTKGFLLTNIAKGSPADKAGLQAGTNTTTINGREIDVGGDIILKIDDKQVSDIYDIMRYVSQKQVGDKLHLTVLRDNQNKELNLTLGVQPSQNETNSFNNVSNTGLANDENKSPQELYDECVGVAGKSLCNFLFKK